MDNKIHIGKLIQKKMDEDGRRAKWLADKLPCHVSNIYRIYEQQFPATEHVNKICAILDIDLYPYYSEHLRELIQRKNDKK